MMMTSDRPTTSHPTEERQQHSKKRRRSHSKRQTQHPPPPDQLQQPKAREHHRSRPNTKNQHDHASNTNDQQPPTAFVMDFSVFTAPRNSLSHNKQQKHHKQHDKSSISIESLGTNEGESNVSFTSTTIRPQTSEEQNLSAQPHPVITSITTTTSIWWSSPDSFIPLPTEQDMIRVLLRWGAKERGMIRDQPAFRLGQIQQLCARHRVRLSQALSLRRHHIKHLNPFKSLHQLGLGSERDIRTASQLFEQAVEGYLRDCKVDFKSESQQRHEYQQQSKASSSTSTPTLHQRPTPDFLLDHQPIVITKFRTNRNGQRIELERRTIHWMEAKMFYGASTIPHDNKSAVGCVLSTATKYVQLFGEGAFIFMYGCGDRLAQELAQVGVMVLDCSDPDGVDLEPVERQQRQWCGNQDGLVLF